jgi:hypothetical protein
LIPDGSPEEWSIGHRVNAKPKTTRALSTRVVDRGFGACKGGERETGEKQAPVIRQSHKTRQVIKCTCLICKYARLLAVVCLIFSVPALVRVLNKEEALMCGVLVLVAQEQKICTINFGQRLLPILRTRDRATSSADFTDPCFLLCSLSPRAIGRFFLQRKRQRAEIFFLIRR